MKLLIVPLVLLGAALAAPRPAAAESAPAQAAAAALTTVVGYLRAVAVAPDGKSATATLLVKGKLLEVLVKDKLTLDKFKIKKIRLDDEIRCKYRTIDGKTVSEYFRRTAGC